MIQGHGSRWRLEAGGGVLSLITVDRLYPNWYNADGRKRAWIWLAIEKLWGLPVEPTSQSLGQRVFSSRPVNASASACPWLLFIAKRAERMVTAAVGDVSSKAFQHIAPQPLPSESPPPAAAQRLG
jgi:hypothetical protein